GVRIAALNEAGALAYYLTDQVDSVSTVLDDEGNTLSLMQYLPYGETFVQRGDLNFSPKFNSQELDRESGFYFFNARFYDPGIARFTSADSVIDGEFDTQGWNRFSYVKGNPIGAKDPTGHLTQLIPIAVRVGQSIAAAGMALCSSGTINCGDMIPSKADKPRDTSVSPNDAKQMEKTGLDPLNAKKGSQKSIGDGGKNGGNAGVSNKGNNTGNRKADFIVSPDGAIMHNSPGKVKDSLSKAGFPTKERDPNKKEGGTIFNIPEKKMDVRIMDGGPNHPPRVVTTRENKNMSVNPNTGENFRGNMKASEQKSRNHMYFQ
ncbi:RHS repeat domain-containing protein, partial [Leptospira kirschneri]|uniref:RHS repeat domain-containing protein n=1 Tax=Leptospira kirschneri TaxID=29507 RepID=UPI003563BBAD